MKNFSDENRKNSNVDTYNHGNELWKHYAKGKKLVTKDHILSDSVWKVENRYIYKDRNLFSGCLGLSVLKRNGVWLPMETEFFRGLKCSKTDDDNRCKTEYAKKKKKSPLNAWIVWHMNPISVKLLCIF